MANQIYSASILFAIRWRWIE